MMNKHEPFKGTVDVILCNLPFIEWHVRITMLPLKNFSDQDLV